jgi:xanthine dehydrogenase accessory factor
VSPVPSFATLERALREETWVAQATVISEPGLGARMLVWRDGTTEGSLGDPALDRRAVELALEPDRTTGPVEVGGVELFVEIFAPLPKLVIVGAVHVAIHLVHFAKRLGFRSIVVDAREVFATEERFPHADRLVVGWPGDVLRDMKLHESTYCVFLTHDPKLDDPALIEALRSEARYVGALGSSRTHAQRVERLRAAGLDDRLIARIHAPIGVDLGGRRPEEIALSIAAQLVQARYGKA